MINYLTMDELLKMHEVIQETYPDKTINYEFGCLEKRIVEPQTDYFGVEQYPRFFQKASLYLYKISIAHCMTDGNKRLGLIATEYFLNANGYELIATDDELYDFCVDIANDKTRPNIEVVEEWIESHTVEYEY